MYKLTGAATVFTEPYRAVCQALCKDWVNIAMNKMDIVLVFNVYKPLLVFMNCLLKSPVCFSAEESISFLVDLYKHFI